MCTVHKLPGIPCNIHPVEPSNTLFGVKRWRSNNRPWGGYEYASQHRSPPFPRFLLDLVFRKIGSFSRHNLFINVHMLDNRADNRCEIQDIVREGNVLCYFLSLLEVRSTRRVLIYFESYFDSRFYLIFIWTFI